ncbi:hypothetical protein QEH59_04310 [Coraliomargarita sp. SDUM461004]|uniref:Uncharacterized protein n=1 Tax=Thalassobacterium sedimentorum TaxID=3041258 RepID=A0ABU1AFP7_9BACT|nr:Qat anti-phage system associated protein QatB [Coraliomargarita sp. SDUM461004]MDQ8193632.1 hypothetical protein [Coraliomargarita sp. SDUM461004]
MGTSAASSGPKNDSPLIPTWCGELPGIDGLDPIDVPEGGSDEPNGEGKAELPPISLPPDAKRFRAPRASLTSFSRTGNSNTLNRALSEYVGSASGGARTAAHRMAGPQRTASKILSFAQAVASVGTPEALKQFGLKDCQGKSVDEILPLLIDALCLDPGGSIDEGIARDALADAIADLSEQGLDMADEFSEEQLRELFIGFVSNSIKDRVINDVGVNCLAVPDDTLAVQGIEATLSAVISGCVRDAVGGPLSDFGSIGSQQLTKITHEIYEAAYNLLGQLTTE